MITRDEKNKTFINNKRKSANITIADQNHVYLLFFFNTFDNKDIIRAITEPTLYLDVLHDISKKHLQRWSIFYYKYVPTHDAITIRSFWLKNK